MPVLDDSDALPSSIRRVVVAGASGSGKTTLAARIAAILHVPHIELDSLFHGPDWTQRPSFVADVTAMIDQPGWVTEWQYAQVRDQLAAAADAVIWLDLSRPRVMWQVGRRTLRRSLRREQLWNGNVEPPLRTFFTDRMHIVRWAWRTHYLTACRLAELQDSRPELPVIHLRSHSSATSWLNGPLATAAR